VQVLKDADAGGVTVYVLLSNHLLGLGGIANLPAVDDLRLSGVWTACIDDRSPILGSNHQKFACLKNPADPVAVNGSIDINVGRWDEDTHARTNPNRHPGLLPPSATVQPTHDVGILVRGPAVADFERTFRERWNDPTRTFGMQPVAPPQPTITTPVSAPAPAGPHSVQLLHTYGITRAYNALLGWGGYSWSPVGEFTVWAGYLKAIQAATKYIYVEDQYFFPFHWFGGAGGGPCHTLPPGRARDTDLVFQLGEAIKRGVKVAVLVPEPSTGEEPGRIKLHQSFQRAVGAAYLAGVAATEAAAGRPGDFVIATLAVRDAVGDNAVFVHSKLMLCDDEYAAVGSANFNQRSMTHDGELQAGIVDANEQFVRELRKTLWAEHLQRPAGTLDDPLAAFALFKSDVSAAPVVGGARVRAFPTPAPGPLPPKHDTWINERIDPYAGPTR
jgi:phosphatidylserine/phosphatidylglycerophosphate/cardiolipin synthase-like enzyme